VKKTFADALENRGYTTLTPVQIAVTEPEVIGADLLVSAQTGSGKTLGFGLAIGPTILGDAESFEPAKTPLALVIAPTRELALQVKRELSWLYAQTGAVMASCVGGMDMRDERRTLDRGAHIVVATPGRLRDHIMRGSIDLSKLKAVVLDEADEMLDLGFREDLEFILGQAPETRQTMMFSATVPRSIANLAKNYQNDAIRVSTVAEKSQHADIEYQAMTVVGRDSENAIINVLRYFEAPNAIVFCNTRAAVNRFTTRLSNRGFSVVALSGELSQSERTHALQSMRDGRARVCVATDVAARGIDLPNLDLVVHAELPSNHETMLHRSGRTGRAGRKGVSVLIVPPSNRRKAERILNSAKVTATWRGAPSAEEVKAGDVKRMLADPHWHQEIPESDRELTDQLTTQFTAEQIAAAYLRLYQSQHSAPEELSTVVEEKPKPRGAFGPSVWFSLPGGRNEHAEPRRLLPMLCKVGNITKDDIGAIRIQDDESFIEIRKASLDGFLKSVGPNLKVEAGAQLKQLDGVPDLGRSEGPRRSPKPSYSKDKPSYKAEAPRRDSTPIDWNDAPAPRNKKPKDGKPKYAKPEGSGAPASQFKRKKDGAQTKWADKPASGGAGHSTPVGKSNSKKNKARALDAGKGPNQGNASRGSGKPKGKPRPKT
jgi:ATP-dependent RNA helicase DeaD